ncbi:hypothetical protein [Wielerella bovis]|uniref:hypothetical protein n=1 Tax=Wielerella bovis TaxID=2917790 RepID=UPI0020199115|nr:hypothetical protein [Wielerella bovis]MCG7657452.1 hypothetical protein [Wielerella bovis]MCG7659673.1 hypothetical protein [Wielerella bovis]
MKKLPILLSLLCLVNTVYAAPQAIPHEFHGKWVQAGASCDEYENGETVRWWDIDGDKIAQYRFGCHLDKVVFVKPRQFRAKWRCDETDDDGETQKSTPTETFTLSRDGKRLTAFKQNYRFCGKHESKDVFVCRGDKINIAVSSYGNGKDYRYTAWTKSRAQPDLFLKNGTADIDGIGACLHTVYTFTRPNGWQYEVREGGCTAYDNVKGVVTVKRNDKLVSERLCQ